MAFLSMMRCWINDIWVWKEFVFIVSGHVFGTEEARELNDILAGIFPVSPLNEQEDKLFWIEDSTDFFSVKSCYKWLVKVQQISIT